MLKSVIILSLVHCISVFGNPLPELDGRIVGGDPIGISKAPHQVSIQKFHDHSCGGSLIADNWVLSAAHCFRYNTPVKVRVGSSFYDQGGQLIEATKIIKHEDFDSESLANDIALVKLSKKVKLSDSVQIVSLATKDDVQGTRAYLSGWGFTNDTSKVLPKVLHGVEVAVISRALCRRHHLGITVFDNNVCAFALGKDSCQGDSGGPMITNGKLCGIVSWGVGCGSSPGVYTSVPAFSDWIKTNMEKN